MTTASNATSAAAAVVAEYDERARFAPGEIAAVATPLLLNDLLNSANRVTEIPCGAGHFLADYARTGTTATLVDASPTMLAAAVEQASAAGLCVAPTCAYWQEMTLPPDVDLVVVPNGALNQLACQTPIADLLVRLRESLSPGARVLAQVACTHLGGVDTGTFYDPSSPHDVWLADRPLDLTPTAAPVLRLRRQHRSGDRLRIEFDYRDPSNARLLVTTVELVLFSTTTVTDAFTRAGFVDVRLLRGAGQPSEVVAVVGGDR